MTDGSVWRLYEAPLDFCTFHSIPTIGHCWIACGSSSPFSSTEKMLKLVVCGFQACRSLLFLIISTLHVVCYSFFHQCRFTDDSHFLTLLPWHPSVYCIVCFSNNCLADSVDGSIIALASSRRSFTRRPYRGHTWRSGLKLLLKVSILSWTWLYQKARGQQLASYSKWGILLLLSRLIVNDYSSKPNVFVHDKKHMKNTTCTERYWMNECWYSDSEANVTLAACSCAYACKTPTDDAKTCTASTDSHNLPEIILSIRLVLTISHYVMSSKLIFAFCICRDHNGDVDRVFTMKEWRYLEDAHNRTRAHFRSNQFPQF